MARLAPRAAGGKSLIAETCPSLLLVDDEPHSLSAMRMARSRWPDTVRIIITGCTDFAAMAQAINGAGIHQFLTKPWHPDQLLVAARDATPLFQLAGENERLALEMRFLASTPQTKLERRRAALRDGLGFETLLRSPSSAMNAVIDTDRHFASFDVATLITGEPGTRQSAAGEGDASHVRPLGRAVL